MADALFIRPMIRNLLILILIMIGLALVRWLVKDVSRAVFKALGLSRDEDDRGDSKEEAAGRSSEGPTNRLVRDPVSGTYIDEQVAFKETIDGKPFFFESKENRDTYLKNRRTA